ncbi:MarR family transcriptional regulator [Carnobacterium maltaromaticum]|uniref:MarR family winged helix-turn-helix transcriptional regulator n=1 Tax=Carnobacterium maltaromaticum TaxID=2751 RepID=UPI000704AC7F|nr:MarR family transcriptional regulator [Carnobacterium maltaromaticum]MDT1945335.1 MarR family transcriptional regulator [Carnobacterium maltaromaticum]MDT1999706.1 MarR family transcriptional regulator [Carnobacterium maltaromaticum]TFJ32326.1 MarR family transcriptional regulator [Carnobacterium maltaromaticum]TFJ35677.1 MarR family transcriptional regulator [Carnobacterium maltaromaticum]TFJ39494.1 MarR family transcriptional regulator [Carnobacterium maltaromaticum]
MSNLTQEWLNRTREQKKNLELLETRLIEESNITLNEYYVLYFLNISEEKEMRLNDLQLEIGLSQSAMSRMISRMENKNCSLIERHCCMTDRRGIYIGITKSGFIKLKSSQKIVDSIVRKFLN